MAGTTTLYKTVTLEPGEQFTLPPNSELVGATAPEQLSSTCTLPELETLACYTAVIGASSVDGNDSQFFESESGVTPGLTNSSGSGGYMTITGVSKKTSLTTDPTLTTLSGTYLFKEPYGITDGTTSTLANLKGELETLLQGTADLSLKLVNNDGRGYVLYVTVKSTPSVISNLQIAVGTSAATGLASTELKVLIPFYLTSSSFIQSNYQPPTCE